MRRDIWSCIVLLSALIPAPHIRAASLPPPLDAAVAAQVDGTAEEWLEATGAPSTSIAIVQDGKLVYAKAYGNARLGPRVPATSVTRYAIDSVSKEFTAAGILILAEQGKLTLDDLVSKWFPDLGQGSKTSLRQLLTHTSGIRDYWPQDFVPPDMERPTTTQAILDTWAKRPLDFPPGTDWQYSNTGYVLAGAIIEKVSGEKLLPFLRRTIFTPLKMNLVTEDDSAPLLGKDAAGYTRYGLGQLHPAPKEGKGWLFAASNLAMTPSDLALWDIGLIDQSLLTPASYKEEFERAQLRSGVHKEYGLGLDIEDVQGRKRIGHDGGGSGYLAANRIWPDDRAAIVVLTNNDWASPDDLLDRVAFAILPPRPEEARARAVFAGFQAGTVDRKLFTDAGNFYLNDTQLADLKASLGPLGPARLIELRHETKRGGMVTRHWKILCRDKRLEAVERGYPGGQLEQFRVSEKQD